MLVLPVLILILPIIADMILLIAQNGKLDPALALLTAIPLLLITIILMVCFLIGYIKKDQKVKNFWIVWVMAIALMAVAVRLARFN